MLIIGGFNNPSAPVRIHQDLGHEHEVFIRYLHEHEISDQDIVKRVWDTFADTLAVAGGISEEHRKKDVAGKVAVFTSKWAEVEAPESEVLKFAWGAALIDEMAGRSDGGNETGPAENLIEF